MERRWEPERIRVALDPAGGSLAADSPADCIRPRSLAVGSPVVADIQGMVACRDLELIRFSHEN